MSGTGKKHLKRSANTLDGFIFKVKKTEGEVSNVISKHADSDNEVSVSATGIKTAAESISAESKSPESTCAKSTSAGSTSAEAQLVSNLNSDYVDIFDFVNEKNNAVIDNCTKYLPEMMDILIDKVIAHPEYSPTKFFNDIALVKLREDVRLSPLVQPVCLPTPELKAKNIVGYQPFIAGWGGTSFKGPSSSRLLEIQIPIINNKDCNEKFKTKGASIISQQLCAGTPAGGKDACQGDSGGPMMLPVGEDFFLIGVVSYGYKCAEPGFPGVYTRVADYVDWIKESVSK